MFEKVFALLLRLYPASFRKEYEREALQIIQDRLRDETGFFQRTRLVWDLLADGLFGLPQAYRNSYPPSETAALPLDTAGVPSFSVLASEPISRRSILLGSALSLSTMIAFGWLLNRSLAHLPVPGWNGHMSPIEAVVERLNQAAPTERPISTSEQASGTPSAAKSEESHQTQPLAPQAHPDRTSQALIRKNRRVAEDQHHAVPVQTRNVSAGSVFPPPRVGIGEAIAWNGVLTDASGSPVRSVDIHVVGTTGELVARTAANGSFEFAQLPSGDYEIVIVRDGREVAYRKVHLSATSSPPRLTLAAGGRLLLSAR
jgi:Carboxypeptidase regulatory-like domain